MNKIKKLKIIIEWKQFKFVGTIDNINKFTKKWLARQNIIAIQ